MAVNITKRVKLDGKGWRFCPVTENARRVIVNGQKLDLDGRYYIDFLQDGERKRLAAGATPAEALAKAEQQKRLLAAQKAAAEAGIELPANVSALAKTEQEKLLAGQNAANAAGIDLPKAPIVSGRPLRETVAKYLDVEVKPHKKPKTYSAYRTALGYFLESCHKATLEEITRTDMLSYKTFLKRKGQTDRSAWNKFASVMSFLKRYEVSLKLKLTSHDWPQYVEEDVEIYTQEQLDAFFGACAKMENLWFTFFLETGMREQEVTHAQWSWVNFERNVITIREVRRFDWQPKKNKGRQIPIPSTLTAALKKWHEKCDPTCGLIFPTAGCRPKMNFLDECKAIAERAKLNKSDFWLHKFRATRITNWLREGLDLPTVQTLAGHSDLESTARYLAAQRIDKVQQHIEKVAIEKVAAANGGK